VDEDEDKVWDSIAGVTAVGAVMLTKPLVERAWRLLFRSDPPGNPAHRDVTWREAVLWAVFTGALVGLVRLVAQRAAAAAWRRATGSDPRGLADTRP